MTNPDGPVAANDANTQPPSPGPRTHTEGLTASGPWLLLSSAVGPPASCQRAGGVNDLTTARKKNKWQSCHYRPEANYTHLAQGHDVVKRTKRFAGYAGFERPLARFKDPFTSRKRRAFPAFLWSISSVCGITRTDTHTHTHGGCGAVLSRTRLREWQKAVCGPWQRHRTAKVPLPQCGLRCTLPPRARWLIQAPGR